MKGEGFDVMKSGDARVALIGFPSVGKVHVTLLVETILVIKKTFIVMCYVPAHHHGDSSQA